MELLYKTTESGTNPESLKLDVDTAFDEPRVLSGLDALRSERLLEKVAGVDNRLELRRKYAQSWKVLSNRNAHRGIIIFHDLLIWVDARSREIGNPAVYGCYLGLSSVEIGFKACSHNLKSPTPYVVSDLVKVRRSVVEPHPCG